MPKKKKDGSSWGLIFSIILHGTIVLLVLLWGINKYTATDINQPINISLSGLEYKGSSDKPGDKVKSKKEDVPEKVQEVKKEEKAEEPEVKEEPKKEVVEEKKEEKEKKEIVEKEEPKKEEPKKEEPKKEEPDKKIVALETKKEEPKKEVKKEPKKEPKKEVKKKKAKPKEKKDETKVARNNVINELKRKNVIDSLNRDENSDGLKGSDKEDVAGTTGKINKALLNVYNNAIWRKIKPKFRIPPNIPTDGSLVTNIFFKVDRKGNVSGVKVAKSSGNPAFDNFCINTIISSSPLPAPPTDIAKLVINEGFEIPLSNNEG